MRIVFFGTPGFAARSLAALLREGHEIAAVVTQPDRPHGRSRSTLIPPPVKVLADSVKLPVLQPERPAGDVFLASIRRLDATLGVVDWSFSNVTYAQNASDDGLTRYFVIYDSSEGSGDSTYPVLAVLDPGQLVSVVNGPAVLQCPTGGLLQMTGGG